MSESNGVWRTVGGRRIFIKDGQSLTSAMKESGKFKSEKVEQIDDDLQEYIKKYTDGEYRVATAYTEYIQQGLTEEEAFEKTKMYYGYTVDDEGLSRKMTEKEFKNSIEQAKKLSEAIDNQKEMNKLLIRFEKTQTDENYRDMQHQYKEGEKIKWGIKSTSQDNNFIKKIAEGKDVIKAVNENSAYPYTYTEYKIIGNKKALDISKYSVYPEQKEVLVLGKFIVRKVEKHIAKNNKDLTRQIVTIEQI